MRLARLLLAVVLVGAAAHAPAASFSAERVGVSRTPMANPHDLKLSPDGRYLFVSDVGNGRVLLIDPGSLEKVSAFGAGEQSGTRDVDFDAAGRAYVADTYNGRVAIYAMDGLEAEFVGELKGGMRGPEGVLAHPNGRIYVAGAWSGNLVAYEDGEVVAELGGLSRPHDVERTPDGDLWLADSGNNRMLLLSPELRIKRKLEGPRYAFNGVRYQDVMPDGTLIVSDKDNHQVKVITPDGALLATLGTGEPGDGPDQFRTPEGIEVRGDTLWIADSGNDRVVKYRIAFGE